MEERLGRFNITGVRLRSPATTHAVNGKILLPEPHRVPVHFRDRDDCFYQSEQAPIADHGSISDRGSDLPPRPEGRVAFVPAHKSF